MIDEEERQQILEKVREAYHAACVRERYHLFLEAFCFMIYQDEVTNEYEKIWNSRNGVSSFTVVSRQGNTASHVMWDKDSRDPQYRPVDGSRVFIDYGPEKALDDAIAMVSSCWDDEKYPLSKNFDNQADAVRRFALDTYKNGVPPSLVEVDEDLRRARGWIR